MKKKIFILLAFFAGFWMVFFLLQNEAVYKNTFGKISKNWVNENGARKLVRKPFQELTNENYIQWDGAHYHFLKSHGYDIHKSGGDFIFAFFPLFPALWHLSSLPNIGVIFLNFLLFVLGLLTLYKAFGDGKPNGGIMAFAIILMLPTNVVFLLPYTEATFLFVMAIGLYGLIKKRYWIYFTGLYLCALTRPSFTFLILSMLGAEIFFFIGHNKPMRSLKSAFFKLLPLIVGTITVSLFQYFQEGGGLTKFADVQKQWGRELSVPHNLIDWSLEGFSMNLGAIFLIAVPIFFMLLMATIKQFPALRPSNAIGSYSPKNYLFITTCFYVIGTFLYILLFQGGSINGLSRYILASPLFIGLIFYAFPYIRKFPMEIRLFTFGVLASLGVIFLGLAQYSTYWTFSDMGMFLLIGVVFFWLFQDLAQHKVYKIALAAAVSVNVLWTAYLFNMYIANGWIYT